MNGEKILSSVGLACIPRVDPQGRSGGRAPIAPIAKAAGSSAWLGVEMPGVGSAGLVWESLRGYFPCAGRRPYIARLDDAVRAAGLTMVEGTSLCMPPAEMGDAVDHVTPPLKDAYARRCFALLAPYLTGQPAANGP